MCGLPFATQARIIAITEIVSSILGILVIAIGSLVLATSSEIKKDLLHKDPDNVFHMLLVSPVAEKVSAFVVPILYLIGELGLAIFLYKSISERNYKRCRIWYIITVTLCMVGLYFFIPGVFFTEDSYYFISIFIVSYIFTAYSVWVVSSFMKEMKSEGLHMPMSQWDDDLDQKL